MEMLDRFGWHTLDEEKLKEVHSKLSAFETMSWSDILMAAKKRNHSIPVPSLIADAQKWLEQKKILLDEVISLRLSGEERVWGYLAEGGVFVLLWWDPRHEICPSVLKHT